MQNVEEGLKDVCIDHINPEITVTVFISITFITPGSLRSTTWKLKPYLTYKQKCQL